MRSTKVAPVAAWARAPTPTCLANSSWRLNWLKSGIQLASISDVTRLILWHRGALRTAQLEGKIAAEHVEQFKAISLANEDALASLNDTYDQYKAQVEAELQAKEVCWLLILTLF